MIRPRFSLALLLVALLLAFSFTVHAQAGPPPSAPAAVGASAPAFGSVAMTWTIPTTRTDGSPLTNLTSFNLYWGTVSGTYPNKVAVPGGATITAFTLTSMPNSTTVYIVASAVDSFGLESAYTNPVTAAIGPAPLPSPPGNLTVGVVTAYTLVKVPNGVMVAVAGTVPLSTPCNATDGVLVAGVTYYAVPEASVHWNRKPNPPAFAQCGG